MCKLFMHEIFFWMKTNLKKVCKDERKKIVARIGIIFVVDFLGVNKKCINLILCNFKHIKCTTLFQLGNKIQYKNQRQNIRVNATKFPYDWIFWFIFDRIYIDKWKSIYFPPNIKCQCHCQCRTMIIPKYTVK